MSTRNVFYCLLERVPETERGGEMESEKTRHRLTLSENHTQLSLDDLELKHVTGYEISKSADLPKNTAELTLHLVVEY